MKWDIPRKLPSLSTLNYSPFSPSLCVTYRGVADHVAGNYVMMPSLGDSVVEFSPNSINLIDSHIDSITNDDCVQTAVSGDSTCTQGAEVWDLDCGCDDGDACTADSFSVAGGYANILPSLATTAMFALTTDATLTKDASLTRFPTAAEMAFVRNLMTLTAAL